MIVKPRITVDDLAEKVGSQSPASSAMSWDDARETLVYDVDPYYEYDADVLFLGAAWVDPQTKYLKRLLPVRHPRKPWLYSKSIVQVDRLSPTGDGVSAKEAIIQSNPHDNQPRYSSKYRVLRYHVEFGPVGYPVLADEELTSPYYEWERFLSVNWKTSVELITAPTGTYKFATSPVNTSPNNQFRAEIGIRECKIDYSYTWHKVPIDLLCGSDWYPTKLMAALGCVNATEFLGHPAGTLLMQPFGGDPKVMPIRDSNGSDAFYVDLVLNFQHFDMPASRRGDAYRGHNTAPAPGDENKYHLFTEDGTTGGAKRYPEYEFRNLFTHHSL